MSFSFVLSQRNTKTPFYETLIISPFRVNSYKFFIQRLPLYFYLNPVHDDTATLIDNAPPTASSGVDCVGVAGVIQKTENEQSNALICITRAKNVGRIGSTDVLRIEEVKLLNIKNPGGEVSKQLNALGKLLSEGEYYFRHGIKLIKN